MYLLLIGNVMIACLAVWAANGYQPPAGEPNGAFVLAMLWALGAAALLGFVAVLRLARWVWTRA